MNKWKIAAIVSTTVVVTFVTLLIIGLALEPQSRDIWEPEPAALDYQSDIPYKDDSTPKELYMSSCDGDGTATRYCLCTWDNLTAKYTVEQINEMGLNYQATGDIPSGFIDAIADCL